MNILTRELTLSSRVCMLAVVLPLIGVLQTSYAADHSDTDSEAKDTHSMSDTTMPTKASEMIGKVVLNAAGEELGEIKDIALDIQNSEALYAVLSSGLILGKLYAVPLAALSNLENDEDFMLDMTEEELENARSFEEGKWPMAANEQFNASSSEFSRFQESGEQAE